MRVKLFLCLFTIILLTQSFSWAQDAGSPTEIPTAAPTEVPTEIPAATPTEAIAPTPTEAPVEVPTPTPVEIPTEAPTEIPVATPTELPTLTPTEVIAPTPTEAPVEVPTPTPVGIPTEAPTSIPVATPTELPTLTPTEVIAPTPTEAPVEVPTPTPVEIPTEAPTDIPVATPTELPTLTPTEVIAPTPTDTPEEIPTATPVIAPTEIPEATPTDTPTFTSTDVPTTPTKISDATPAEEPTATPTVVPTEILDPSATPTAIIGATPTEEPTAMPTEIIDPSTTPTASPTEIIDASTTPIATPTEITDATPTEEPTVAPTEILDPSATPTATPTEILDPSATPSATPTEILDPSATPTATPTEILDPSATPTATPTEILDPSATPTEIFDPTAAPTEILDPSATPTAAPTEILDPSATPTAAPTEILDPSATPSATPTEILDPSATPTEIFDPSATPSVTPTEILDPSATPTAAPTEILDPSATPSATPTEILDPSATPTEIFDPSATPSVTPTEILDPSATPTEIFDPSATPSVTPTEILDPSATPTEIFDPSATPTEIFDPSATPTEIFDPSATPTEILDASATPSATITNTPVPVYPPYYEETPVVVPPVSVTKSLYPNVNINFVKDNGYGYSLMAVDQTTNQLYTTTIRNHWFTIAGPYSSTFNKYQQFIYLQYAQLVENSVGNPLSMMIAHDHSIFVSFPNSIIRVIAQNQTEKIDLPANTEPFLDLYEVKEGDIIPDTKPGDLLGLTVKDKTNTASIVVIDYHQSPAILTTLYSWDLNGKATSICTGLDNLLYISAMKPTDGTDPDKAFVYKVEKDATINVFCQFAVRGKQSASIQYLLSDQALYFRTQETMYRIQPARGIVYDLFSTANTPSDSSELVATGDGYRLLFMNYVQQKQNQMYLGILSLSVTGPFGGIIDPYQPTATPTVTPTEIFRPTATPQAPLNTPTPTIIKTPTPYGNSKRFIREYSFGSYGSHDDPQIIMYITFAPDGKSFYTTGANNRDMRWNFETGEAMQVYDFGYLNPAGPPFLSKDGKKLYQNANYDTFRSLVCDTNDTGILSNKEWYIPISRFQLFDNGNKSIMGINGTGFYIWDMLNDQLILKTPLKTDENVSEISVSPQEDYCVLINNRHNSEKYNNAILWDLKKQTLLHTISLYPKVITDACWVSGGKYVWLISYIRRIDNSMPDTSHFDLFNAETGEHLYQISLPALGFYVHFTQSGDKYLYAQGNTVKVCSTFTGEILAELPHADTIESIIFSPDEKMVLTGSNNITGPAAVRLWDISDLADYPIPTFVPFTPTATESPTSTPTPSYTPTPNRPVVSDTKYEIQPAVRNILTRDQNTWESGGKFAFDPKTGELILAQIKNKNGELMLNIYKYPTPSEYTLLSTDIAPFISYRVANYEIGEVLPCENGTILVNQWDVLHILRPDGNNQTITIDGRTIQALHVVTTSSRIPDTKPGDVLLMRRAWKDGYTLGERIDKLDMTDSSKGFIPLIDIPLMPEYLNLVDFDEGPGGYLYILLTGTDTSVTGYTGGRGPTKILYWNENKQFKEWTHFSIDDTGRWFWPRIGSLHYAQQEGVFYIAALQNHGEYNTELLRVANSDTPVQLIAQSKLPFTIMHSSSGKVYVLSQGDDSSASVSAVVPLNAIAPTPTPAEPAPTPTPLAGWFVLDGFGGIHSTNPNVPLPVLPYWIDFNIVRDIEPDPLGRGWYMLDGFGGIHTSSPDLPKPVELPYFGFDIARKLKVKQVNGKYEFYLLDGYGVIHTTDTTFDESKVIWFGNDIARGLQLGEKSNEWTMMDTYGTLYSSKNSTIDIIRFTHPYLISSIMRNFVRFPDETTVMLDLFGGRHTNQYFPANDVVKGLSTDFYFFGWDIVWDMEVIPENMAKRGN